MRRNVELELVLEAAATDGVEGGGDQSSAVAPAARRRIDREVIVVRRAVADDAPVDSSATTVPSGSGTSRTRARSMSEAAKPGIASTASEASMIARIAASSPGSKVRRVAHRPECQRP